MNTSTALALPEAAQTAVNPKPTRAEIIDALVIVKLEKTEAERKKRDDDVALLRAEVEEALASLLAKQLHRLSPDFTLGEPFKEWNEEKRRYENTDRICGVSARLDLTSVLPKALVTKLLALHALESKRFELDPKEVRKEISASLSDFADRSTRVAALLKNSDARKSLESMLEKIEA